MNLIEKDLIFKEDFVSLDQAFKCLSKIFLERGLVKQGYLEALMEREKNYPTGIDLTAVSQEFPNIAIPHTESMYCNATKVIVIKLERDIVSKDMMNPDKDLNVKYLFMILNKDGGEQSNILAKIMEFATNKENISMLAASDSLDSIYDVVNKLNA
ncbi:MULTISPECIES: PTS sugar transporter subunit IIA [Clostridium]|uniref:PTS transporter subunit EIIA n=1 Tax=Clostridium butyricum TaxID=1492 RepID=A0A6L9ENL5_CLOBU|nr:MULTISPECIES: PTS sugar transporter subunit IIA [Clostridium]AXB86286.1 PTS sugar transporter subunit IIA [Clostridium butyricum]KIU09462.1 pts system enzyme iibc component [Clostridium butyricum]MBA8965789.1 PTS system galactitol-specific IIA component [Clostridium butyricum]MBA8969654.1 PTS system galactitol-specific IIA component [Clostridium butyricum]MBC2427019.1 PTS sugar transporter subunit IIA [Clostridium butyricum]